MADTKTEAPREACVSCGATPDVLHLIGDPARGPFCADCVAAGIVGPEETKTETTIAADELKAAAANLLEIAKGDASSAMVHPHLAKHLAAWMASAAWWAERRGGADKYALAVARVLNGTAP
ncbi:hypothetical protein E1286_05025 [Nonomuraea terrae]|uniref:Uncharacterized protein n=1 Tax=Nonomuraea terrae TaxID=2530383 RepID=A0A4R4Z9A4_9ACTN|nr:hypothetical protein [Nonomuraea terrae]TDD54556.1 hypothetical protein E1286_05025 [Nonomuraea terrae]